MRVFRFLTSSSPVRADCCSTFSFFGQIVDDSYILTGSANINQRSLDGDRDSELAIGAYQPHRRGGCSSGGGEVFLFRMSLFREHLSRSDPVLADPRSEACASFVREAALQGPCSVVLVNPEIDNVFQYSLK